MSEKLAHNEKKRSDHEHFDVEVDNVICLTDEQIGKQRIDSKGQQSDFAFAAMRLTENKERKRRKKRMRADGGKETRNQIFWILSILF